MTMVRHNIGSEIFLFVFGKVDKYFNTNINKLFKMSGKMQEKPLSYIYLNAQYTTLVAMSYEQRISELGLNPDRADVIIPALRVYLNAMKWSGARNIYVPKIGLSDGIIKALYYGRI